MDRALFISALSSPAPKIPRLPQKSCYFGISWAKPFDV